MSDSDEEGGGNSEAGFLSILFGNLDEDGLLEESGLGEETAKALMQLKDRSLFGDLLQEVKPEQEETIVQQQSREEVNLTVGEKDYFDEDELIEDQTEKLNRQGAIVMSTEDEEEEEDEQLDEYDEMSEDYQSGDGGRNDYENTQNEGKMEYDVGLGEHRGVVRISENLEDEEEEEEQVEEEEEEEEEEEGKRGGQNLDSQTEDPFLISDDEKTTEQAQDYSAPDEEKDGEVFFGYEEEQEVGDEDDIEPDLDDELDRALDAIDDEYEENTSNLEDQRGSMTPSVQNFSGDQSGQPSPILYQYAQQQQQQYQNENSQDQIRYIKLPLLGQSAEGEQIIHFSELFNPQYQYRGFYGDVFEEEHGTAMELKFRRGMQRKRIMQRPPTEEEFVEDRKYFGYVKVASESEQEIMDEDVEGDQTLQQDKAAPPWMISQHQQTLNQSDRQDVASENGDQGDQLYPYEYVQWEKDVIMDISDSSSQEGQNSKYHFSSFSGLEPLRRNIVQDDGEDTKTIKTVGYGFEKNEGFFMDNDKLDRILRDCIISTDTMWSNYDWTGDVLIDGVEDVKKPKAPLIFDLNDPYMTFEVQPNIDVKHLQSICAAQIREATGYVESDTERGGGHLGDDEFENGDIMHGLRMGRDANYSRSRKRKGDKGDSNKACRHSILAITLSTLPIVGYSKEAYNNRHPLGVFCIGEGNSRTLQGVRPRVSHQGEISILLLSLNGRRLNIAALLTGTLQEVWAVAATTKFNESEGEVPTFYGGHPRGPLPVDVRLQDLGFPREGAVIYVVFRIVKLLKSPSINRLAPPGDNARPPGAFTTKSSLIPSDGHVILVEYFEQQPLLLAGIGMGIKLVSYYRKKSATDSGYEYLYDNMVDVDNMDNEVLNSSEDQQSWKVGQVTPLQPEDESPFLGQIPAGGTQMSMESNMFRCPAFPYETQHTDFLLIRSSQGTMQLREITGTITAGQQEPHVRIPPPSSSALKDYDEKRIISYVTRDLRAKQRKLIKKNQNQACACVYLDELLGLFPRMSEHLLKQTLKTKCECNQVRGRDDEGGGRFELKEGARLLSEQEVRQLLEPEMVCAADGMMMHKARLERLGIRYLNDFTNYTRDKIRVAIEQLEDREEVRAAAALLLLEAQNMAWILTDSFVSTVKEGKGWMVITGLGDPSGHGTAYSYIKDVRKKEAPVDKKAAREQSGGIMGTDSDLRRMKKEHAQQLLRDLGIPEDTIKVMNRWDMIAMLRELGSAAAQDASAGIAADANLQLTNFARKQKLTVQQQIKNYRSSCQHVFDRQRQLLSSESYKQAAPPYNISSTSLVNSLLCDKKDMQPSKDDDLKGEQQDDEEAIMRQMMDEGFFSSQSQILPASESTKPVQGETRLRRTIIYSHGDGTETSRELIYNDQNKIYTLNMLYQGRDESKTGYVGTQGFRKIEGPPWKPFEPDEEDKVEASIIRTKGYGVGRPTRVERKPQLPSGNQVRRKPGGAAGGGGQTPRPPPSTNRRRRHRHEEIDKNIEQLAELVDAPPPRTMGISNTAKKSRDGGSAKRKRNQNSELEGKDGEERDSDIDLSVDFSRKRRRSASQTKELNLSEEEGEEETGPPLRRQRSTLQFPVGFVPYGGRIPRNTKGEFPTGRKVLAQYVLDKVLTQLRSEKFAAVFIQKVTRDIAPDYNSFVDPKDEIWLDRMRGKIKGCKYTSRQEFLNDIEQIRINAVAYNSLGCGKYGGSTIIQDAKNLVETAYEIIYEDQYASLADEAERYITQEQGGGGLIIQPEMLVTPQTVVVMDQWIQCDICGKWRQVSASVFEATYVEGQEWQCSQNYERPGASCDDIADWEPELPVT